MFEEIVQKVQKVQKVQEIEIMWMWMLNDQILQILANGQTTISPLN